MFDDPNLGPPPRKGMSVYLVVSLIVFGLAAAYVGELGRVFEGMGGDRFDILNFFPYPGEITRGDSTMLCYSVSNAKSVTLQPQSNAVWPAFERCVSVSPKKTTIYTLTATDAAGHTKSATVTVTVD